MIPVGQIRNISVLDIRPDTYWRYLASRISGYGKVRISGQMSGQISGQFYAARWLKNRG